MVVVFSTLFDMRGSGIKNFSVYLIIGQLLFNFFNEGTGSAMGSMQMCIRDRLKRAFWWDNAVYTKQKHIQL